MFVQQIRKVKRALFGPVDPKATQKFLENELKKISVSKSEKWNFDFKSESTLEPTGAFHWRVATPRKENVPVKRKVEEDFDISSQYCDLAEADLVRPRPIKSSPSNGDHKNQQSRITGKKSNFSWFILQIYQFQMATRSGVECYSNLKQKMFKFIFF